MNSIALPDGRSLAYDEYGDADAPPVVFCHGTPGSRRSAAVFDDCSVRVIAPDRPGIGGSDPDPGRDFDSWREDVVALTDELGIDEFGVVGFSGGGPFALAAGDAPGATAVGLLAPSGPPEVSPTDPLTVAGRYAPILLRGLFAVQRPIVRRNPDAALSLYTDADPSELSIPDGVDPVEVFAEDALTATEQGGKWLARELALLSESWSIPNPEVAVTVWYGEDDENVPPSVAKAVADETGAETVALSTDHLETLCEARDDCVSFVSPSA
ncbi:alpha/beta fold hydrolase [Natronomonas sp. CBA1123]|uniref:alpha/beta fold hydrolase n=1 Tax=Natronomonas sp. CBA1123 TaxID=2668070 RepID=UPI0012EA97E0|nr:alpha/beta hydrolase [Natronomonas sp. CBA1123]MUV86334.1 alpha/beta fold hydrolase [Natronomonas sp. CBA1123]